MNPFATGTPFGAYGPVRYTNTGTNCSFACAIAAKPDTSPAISTAPNNKLLNFSLMWLLLFDNSLVARLGARRDQHDCSVPDSGSRIAHGFGKLSGVNDRVGAEWRACHWCGSKPVGSMPNRSKYATSEPR